MKKIQKILIYLFVLLAIFTFLDMNNKRQKANFEYWVEQREICGKTGWYFSNEQDQCVPVTEAYE